MLHTRGQKSIQFNRAVMAVIVFATITMGWYFVDIRGVAHDICVVGEPPQTTCTESLLHVGYMP
jgi:hypothetical protein